MIYLLKELVPDNKGRYHVTGYFAMSKKKGNKFYEEYQREIPLYDEYDIEKRIKKVTPEEEEMFIEKIKKHCPGFFSNKSKILSDDECILHLKKKGYKIFKGDKIMINRKKEILTYHFYGFPYNLKNPNKEIKTRVTKRILWPIRQKYKDIKFIEDDIPNKNTFILYYTEDITQIKKMVIAWAEYYEYKQVCSLYEFNEMIKENLNM
ncbi:MAG: hypothetical protein LBK29_02590 [Oscillospiraceae bacterium]|nr:hypothetical protein [Oscillospiraceae bacterium]